MLWGKIAVFGGVVFLTMLVASFSAFLVGQALLHGQHLDASLADPGALRAVVGAALYVTVAGITALALGALLRNTAAAISTFVAVFFVIPTLTLLLPASLTDHFLQYLPSNLGGALTGDTTGLAHALAPWTGFAVLCGYAAALIGLRRLAAPPRRRLTHAQPVATARGMLAEHAANLTTGLRSTRRPTTFPGWHPHIGHDVLSHVVSASRVTRS